MTAKCKRQLSILKLNKFKYSEVFLNWENIPLFYNYLFLYFFQGLHSYSLGVWFYFHGLFLNAFTIFVLVLEIYLKYKQVHRNLLNKIFRSTIWSLYVILIVYQQVYQTAVNFELFIYFFNHIELLITDLIGFLYQWKLSQWFLLLLGFYWILFTTRKKILIPLSVVILFFLSYHSEMEGLDVSNPSPLSNLQSKRVKTVLSSIPEKPNIVFVILEGVSRKQLAIQTSKYIDFSVLNGSHFWIPMPHTSKSLFTWMTGQPQLNQTRIQLEEYLLESSLPVQLEKNHNYQTIMIYTQSIYFEGMEKFFPRIFQTVLDKTILEKEYGSLYSSFSWGMDDRVILAAQRKINLKTNSPLFILIGLSQTHSPYFVSTQGSDSQWISPSVRHKVSLGEEVKVLDSLISFWKENVDRETLLIIAADHGESFGEEGAHAHNYSLYNQETDVPFLFYFLKSSQIYIPKLGSSVDFKTTILSLLNSIQNQENSMQENNFFVPNYELSLFLKTWNSEIQKSLITSDKKYIYHSDRDQLFQMDHDDNIRKQVFDVHLKQKVVNQIYTGIR